MSLSNCHQQNYLLWYSSDYANIQEFTYVLSECCQKMRVYVTIPIFAVLFLYIQQENYPN